MYFNYLLIKNFKMKGPIAQLFGRKTAIIVYGLPITLGWFLLFMAKNVPTLMIGRIITGVCAGLVSGTVPSYGDF